MHRLPCFLVIFLIMLMPVSAYAEDSAEGPAEKGTFVFKRYCILCHQSLEHPDEEQFRVRAGLDLRGIYNAESSIGLGVLDDARLFEWIKDPRKLKPDTKMIRMPLNDTQIHDVIAYIKTFSAPHEVVAAGKVKAPPVLRRCHSCHDFRRGGKMKVGPPLFGVYGRAPSIDGVPFRVWDAVALDAWLTNPRAVKADTKMRFPGLKKKKDRDAIINYLKHLH